MAINITSPQTGQIDRTQSSIPVTWTNSDSIYNGHQSSYEIQYKYVADASWNTLGRVTSSAQQGDLKGIFTALGTDAKEIYYRICVRYDLFTSPSLGAIAGGVDYSAVYSIIFRGGDQIGTLKIYDGRAIKEHPIYESVSGYPKLNVRVSNTQTGQVPLVPEGDRQAGNIKVAVTASDTRVAAGPPKYTISGQYANGYFYGYKYQYSINYGYYYYISSYYRNYAYRIDSYNSGQQTDTRLEQAEYYYYTYAHDAYYTRNYLTTQIYNYIGSYYNTYGTNSSNTGLGVREESPGYISYNYSYYTYRFYIRPYAVGSQQIQQPTYYSYLASYSLYYFKYYAYFSYYYGYSKRYKRYSLGAVGTYSTQRLSYYMYYTKYYGYYYRQLVSGTDVMVNSIYNSGVYSYYNYYTTYTYSYNYISQRSPVYNYNYFYYNSYYIVNYNINRKYMINRYVDPVYSYYHYYTKYYHLSSYHSGNTTVYGIIIYAFYNDLSYNYKYYRQG